MRSISSGLARAALLLPSAAFLVVLSACSGAGGGSTIGGPGGNQDPPGPSGQDAGPATEDSGRPPNVGNDSGAPTPPSCVAPGGTCAATSAFDAAYDLAGEPGAPPQCRFIPATLTMLAAQMGVLDAGHRRRALDVVRAATAPGDLLAWLSPRVFRVLGAVDEAEARVKSLGPQAGAYAEWLDAIAQPE